MLGDVEVKGTAFLARRAFLVGAFGQDAWDAFFDTWRANEPAFADDIIAVTSLPVEPFLRLNDAVVDEFYDGEAQTHWLFGQASAEWALREGPYKAFFRSGAVANFLRTSPTLWRAYYSAGSFRVDWNADTRIADAHIEVSTPHVHFEFNVMGYLSRAIELTGETVVRQDVVAGFSRGDSHVHYRFQLA